MTWLGFSLIAFIGFGLQNFLYKVAAARASHSRTVTFYFIVVSTLALWILILAQRSPLLFSKTVVLLAICDAVLFYTTTISRIEALRYIPVHLAFPLMRTSTLLVALSGVLFFGESIDLLLVLAIILLLLAAYLISVEREEDKQKSTRYRWGLFLTAIALLTSTGTNIVSKLAAEHAAILEYMTLANTMIIFLSYIEIRVVTGEHLRKPSRSELLIACGLAISNVLAWFAYLYALQIGPLSLTAVIAGMGFIVPIILSALVYGEHLTLRRTIAVLCTIASIICVKFSH